MSSEEKNPKNFSSNSNKFRKNSLNKKANRIFSLPKNYKVTDIQNVQKLFENNKKYKNLLKGALDKELVVKDRVKNYSQYSMDSKNFPNINLSNYSKNVVENNENHQEESLTNHNKSENQQEGEGSVHEGGDKKKRKRRTKADFNGEVHKCPECEKSYFSGPALINHRKS